MIYCPHYEFCISGAKCPRALTEQVKHDAIMEYGSDDAPLDIYLDKPWCYEDKEEQHGNSSNHRL